LRIAVEKSTISLPDGKGFTVAARIAGVRFQETVPGRWLMWQPMRRAAERGLAVYLFGSTEERLARCARNLTLRFPDLQIAGWLAPPHVEELTLDFVRQTALLIRRANADLLFLALGTPKQEVWMYRAQPYSPARLMIGVGGALDVLAGARLNPPDWVNRTGFEWAFRLAQEPRRLWRRYLLHDPRVIVWALRDRLRSLPREAAGSE
jgi:N-acetylglucosaminyldiphosphoundecaprenol N-acetyl-beta-D-mannosaminyltransferase